MIWPDQPVVFYGPNPVFLLHIKRNGIDCKAFVFILLILRNNIGIFPPAGATPGCPEINQYHVTTQTAQRHFCSFRTWKYDLRRALPYFNTHRHLLSCSFPFSSGIRSEEHTSELQSLMRISYAVFCLKKKTNTLNT